MKFLDEVRHFVIESNSIEHIFRDPFQEEIDELVRFINLDVMTIKELERFVSVYQPNAKLRNKPFMDVRVGNYIPPNGGPNIPEELNKLLNSDASALDMHIHYECIHPFTDCNGRSGRALWAWKNKVIAGGFLYNFYMQVLRGASKQYEENNL